MKKLFQLHEGGDRPPSTPYESATVTK